MATHYLNKTIHKTWNIKTSNDTWVLGEDGRITGMGFPGVVAADSITDATIRIKGDILLGGVNSGMHIGAQHAEITIGKTGHISSGGYAIHYDNIADENVPEVGTVSIYNRGWLEGGSGIVAATAAKGGVIRNAGTIDVTYDGIVSAGAHNTIVNTGVIKAGQSGIVAYTYDPSDDALLGENAVRIINDGTIEASGDSIFVSGVAVNIDNRGLLRGGVDMDEGDDILDNQGLIYGDIHMGNGDDILHCDNGKIMGYIYAGRGNDTINLHGAKYAANVFGGEGNDSVHLNSASTLFVEFADEGIDMVSINGSYSLGANVEDLLLQGTGNHTGVGNELDNWIGAGDGNNTLFGLGGNDVLAGGEGHDTLWGGAGGDYFYFASGDGSDLIMDFEKGSDHFSFGGDVPGVSSFSDLDGKINIVGDDLVITLGNSDELVLKNAAANEITLTADDFIF